MKIRLFIPLIAIVLSLLCFTPTAWAFCGFYVAKADAKLYNKASQVIIARDGDRTILTMANDFQGDVKDFALVVPVPTVLKKEQVKVAVPKIIERLDAFSAPRLVEYFDPDPCAPDIYDRMTPSVGALQERSNEIGEEKAGDRNLGVTIEAKFNVGEYDILILSAKESGGLQIWLNRNGYKIPKGASELLKPYIRSSMKFFVAKVNLNQFNASGYQNLRPLQISYQSPKFILPIRLGMINSTSEQDLIVYILSPKGQAEITNYRTVKVPSNVNIPVYIKNEFGDFYKSMFQTSYNKEDKKVGFLEYAWDMGSCDPCSAEPLNNQELEQAGVFWLKNNSSNQPVSPQFRSRFPSSNNVFITRLHVRYSRNKFPEDLIFQETSNQESFQGRYILQHPFTGNLQCSAGKKYQRSLRTRFEKEAQTLANLTNWNIQKIRQKMKTTMNIPDLDVVNVAKNLLWWYRFLGWLGIAS
ncbi:DUF2330 domain-containing protein [Anabaena sp. FACHB-1237]|uniref:DUF2330 domain-containing protein n=1 Tax=Anabaena sp. FACHB-1237 TaxID=2692769 RepID=UPI0016818806|nr:DUF2330 domain-containing protein [Anabaena sp. FACHB-1237]MBD2136200.1 DUF2330 domain-containing protein [Anabaena sp. FACHB-1237]